MDFANERWVKLYTRDTASWSARSWPARNLLMQLLRKVDRLGCIDLGHFGVRALAGMLGAADHRAEIESSLRELVEDGAVELSEDGSLLTLPKFVEAQETRMSASARAKLSRDKKKASASVTKRDGAVTRRDGAEAQPTVTKRDATVTKRDGDATLRDADVESPSDVPASQNVTVPSHGVTVASQKVENPCRGVAEQNRTEQKRGVASLPRARVSARETPPSSKSTRAEGGPERLVATLASAIGDLWTDEGEDWRREELGKELGVRGFDEPWLRRFGAFLARSGVAESLKTSRFSPYWFVFGGSPQGAEFRHLDAAEGAFDAWCEEEDERKEAAKRLREKRAEAEKQKARALSPEEVAAKFKAAKVQLLAQRPLTPASASVGVTLGDAIDEFLDGAPAPSSGGQHGR